MWWWGRVENGEIGARGVRKGVRKGERQKTTRWGQHSVSDVRSRWWRSPISSPFAVCGRRQCRFLFALFRASPTTRAPRSFQGDPTRLHPPRHAVPVTGLMIARSCGRRPQRGTKKLRRVGGLPKRSRWRVTTKDGRTTNNSRTPERLFLTGPLWIGGQHAHCQARRWG